LAVADATGGSGRDFEHYKVRTGCTTNGHWCSSSAADPDERRTRGPRSL